MIGGYALIAEKLTGDPTYVKVTEDMENGLVLVE